jgi:glucose-6-phosphate isomerase
MDEERTNRMIREFNKLYIDFSRQNMNQHTLQLLLNLAERAKLKTKINAMFAGNHINNTEDRAVLHTATRARRDDVSRDCRRFWGEGEGGGGDMFRDAVGSIALNLPVPAPPAAGNIC